MQELEAKILIAGPCSAESYEQMEKVCHFFSEQDSVHYIRAGIWKPRTRPGSFEGKGEEALQWLEILQKKYPRVPFMIEVASPTQLEAGMKYGLRNFWIGARTTVNPFLVQNLADAIRPLKNLHIWVKNPMHPDVHLWLGSIERLENTGSCSMLGAIHRGFYHHGKSPFRNDPHWSVPMQLKTIRKDIPLVCDISHIAGKREFLHEILSTALWLNFNGFMMEVHPEPDAALSDKSQQISFNDFLRILQTLKKNNDFKNFIPESIRHYRKEIDHIDFEIIQLLSSRMKLAAEIGEIKNIFQIPVFQPQRWKEILSTRPEWAEQAGLSCHFIEKIWVLIHNESIGIQNEIIRQCAQKKINTPDTP